MSHPTTDPARAPTRGLARLGVLVPFTNTNLEPDLALLAPPGVSIHAARLGGYDRDAIPDEAQMAGLGAADLDEPLRLIQGVRPDVILYGCTSATLTHGPAFDRDLAGRIKAASGAETVTAAGALVHALGALRVQRIGFASPYVGEINDQAIAFLAEAGFETAARADIGRVLDNDGQGALTPDAVFDLGLRADAPGVEALVLSCTDMRAVEVVDRLEAATDKPVVCSNQAMMHQALEITGLAPARACGQLLRAA
ncbi:MAG: Asp/Glu racemase [Pseudomonadota bacterium]